MKKDLISIKDLSCAEVTALLSLARRMKEKRAEFFSHLSGKTLALIFEKPSNRTYVSFQVGMYQLGGNSVYLGPEQIKLGVRETVADVARTLSRYVDAIVLRTFDHQNVLDMAAFARVPVINGLSDLLHPCQALADAFTIGERCDSFSQVTLAYVGDGNNVCHSLLFVCAKLGMHMNVATPPTYVPDDHIVAQARQIASGSGSVLQFFHDPRKAVDGADFIYTDVWASMGQEKEAAKRKRIFRDFQVNADLVALAKKGVGILHCLPAHRKEEITDDMLDGPHSLVFDQAENRLHVQKAILATLLARGE
jgi:ornithine carbamoyltransferase